MKDSLNEILAASLSTQWVDEKEVPITTSNVKCSKKNEQKVLPFYHVFNSLNQTTKNKDKKVDFKALSSDQLINNKFILKESSEKINFIEENVKMEKNLNLVSFDGNKEVKLTNLLLKDFFINFSNTKEVQLSGNNINFKINELKDYAVKVGKEIAALFPQKGGIAAIPKFKKIDFTSTSPLRSVKHFLQKEIFLPTPIKVSDNLNAKTKKPIFGLKVIAYSEKKLPLRLKIVSNFKNNLNLINLKLKEKSEAKKSLSVKTVLKEPQAIDLKRRLKKDDCFIKADETDNSIHGLETIKFDEKRLPIVPAPTSIRGDTKDDKKEVDLLVADFLAIKPVDSFSQKPLKRSYAYHSFKDREVKLLAYENKSILVPFKKQQVASLVSPSKKYSAENAPSQPVNSLTQEPLNFLQSKGREKIFNKFQVLPVLEKDKENSVELNIKNGESADTLNKNGIALNLRSLKDLTGGKEKTNVKFPNLNNENKIFNTNTTVFQKGANPIVVKSLIKEQKILENTNGRREDADISFVKEMSASQLGIQTALKDKSMKFSSEPHKNFPSSEESRTSEHSEPAPLIFDNESKLTDFVRNLGRSWSTAFNKKASDKGSANVSKALKQEADLENGEKAHKEGSIINTTSPKAIVNELERSNDAMKFFSSLTYSSSISEVAETIAKHLERMKANTKSWTKLSFKEGGSIHFKILGHALQVRINNKDESLKKALVHSWKYLQDKAFKNGIELKELDFKHALSV